MEQAGATRVLLLADEFDSSLAVRQVVRHAGLTLNVKQAASREDFFSQLHKEPPALVLVKLEGLSNLPLPEILQHTASLTLPVPVVVTGEDAPASVAPIEAIRSGAADYVRTTEFARLPLIIERVLREKALYASQERTRIDAEKAAQVLRDNHKLVTVGRLAASIAHEINNPLESISNLLFLLQSDPTMSEEANSYLSLAQRELARVAQISRQTLTFQRETPVPIRAQPAELLEEVLGLYVRRIEEKRIQIVRQFKSQELVTLFPGEMRQVFSNLIANAIEASSAGSKLWLRVQRCRQWSDDGILGVRISIGDCGTGITDDVRQRLGEPFYTTKGQHGTGLGLWVTQSIIERYGGFLQLCSSTGTKRHGTVFSIFLPTNMRPRPVLPRSGGTGSGILNIEDVSGPTKRRAKGRPDDQATANLRASGW